VDNDAVADGDELAIQFVPRVLMGAQEIFVTSVMAVALFIVASFYS
jgi:hypothetical protein